MPRSLLNLSPRLRPLFFCAYLAAQLLLLFRAQKSPDLVFGFQMSTRLRSSRSHCSASCDAMAVHEWFRFATELGSPKTAPAAHIPTVGKIEFATVR